MKKRTTFSHGHVDATPNVIKGSHVDHRGSKSAVSRITERPAPPAPCPHRLSSSRDYEEGLAAGLRKGSALLDLTEQEIRLAVGEMTAQEMRTVKAVLAWRKAVIRREAGCKD